MINTLKVRDKNPIFHKFINDGENPTTYITPDRRKEIYDFMRLKVNCAPTQTGSFSKPINHFYKKQFRQFIETARTNSK